MAYIVCKIPERILSLLKIFQAQKCVTVRPVGTRAARAQTYAGSGMHHVEFLSFFQIQTRAARAHVASF